MRDPSHSGGHRPPLVCLHGFMDSARTWDLVRPALEREHAVLTPALPAHDGGPPLPPGGGLDALADWAESFLDRHGLVTAHIAGNSLGGYLALRLAARGRARSVVALAPAGAWADPAVGVAVLDRQVAAHAGIVAAAPYADAIAATPEGRRRATSQVAVDGAHIPPDLVAHMARAAARCDVPALVAAARGEAWDLRVDRITCPVRVVWGTGDRLLPWPAAAAGLRRAMPHADWVALDDAGHAPQLDRPRETAELILGVTRG